MKLLIIEDEEKTAAFLRKGLTETGFSVDVCSTGAEGIGMAKQNSYDLIVLDVMLPDTDGWQVISKLKGGGLATPVIFLTARDSVQDRVKGLELGGNDYLVKPFAFSELLARIKNILRTVGQSRQGEGGDIVKIADLEIDLVRHKARRNNQRLDLTPKEFSLLSLLVRCSGEVLSRTRIAGHIWDVDFESDTNVVDVHMRRLRSKVDDPFEKKLIHTVRGVGYVLEER